MAGNSRKDNTMTWPTDTLTGVFLFLFAFGLLFSVASLLLGVLGGHFHLPGAAHADHAGHLGPHNGDQLGHAGDAPHGHGPAGHVSDGPLSAPAAPSPLNLSTLMIFLTWFGAAGYLLRSGGAVAALSLAVATALGAVGATLAWAFLAKVLWRGQTQLDPYNYRVEGTVGRVTAPIRPDGTGEIIYTLDGKRRVDGARGAPGAAIAANTEVAILRYEGGLAYVTPIVEAGDDVFTLEPEPGPRGSTTGATPRAAREEASRELAE